MSEINKRNARMWSRMGVRASYGLALLEMAKEHDTVLAMSADLGRSSGLNQLMETLPDQFVNVGIAEQNMVGVAAGLVREGFQVYASSFAPFVSMRAGEQVRMNLGYMNIPVTLVALGSGLSMGFLGNSHYGLEDIAVMRTIPGLTIVSPADCGEVFKVIQASVDYPHPLYIRLTGGVNAPVVYQEEYEFTFGKAISLRQGEDICIIACGTMVSIALEVSEALEGEGVNASVINMHTIKPLDEVAVGAAFSNHSIVVSLEEHTVVGGLGGAIAELKSKMNYSARHVVIGIDDCYVATGDHAYAQHEAGLSKEKVLARVLESV